MKTVQVTLSQDQIEAFYHDHFVASQVRNYQSLLNPRLPRPRAVVDIGGGCGFFAQGLKAAAGVDVRVIDMDPVSVQACRAKGLDASVDDALRPQHRGDEDVVCLNLILHHLVGPDEDATLALQQQALASWLGHARWIFVDEYIYDAWFGNVAGHMIYAITSSRTLSHIDAAVSRWVPSLRANTFGVGVRFCARDEWCRIFKGLGYKVVVSVRGPEEGVSAARRLLLIRGCRRDSFLLAPANPKPESSA